mgnify:CR=1 FL=1
MVAGAPPRAQTFLAFDYGQKRTGVASGNRLLGSGRPLMTIKAEGDARFAPIARLIQEPDLAQRMGRLGRQRVLEQLSWEHSAPQLLAAYNRVFAKRGRG